MRMVDVDGLLAGSADPVVHHHIDLGQVRRAWLDGDAAVVEHGLGWRDAPPDALAVLALGPTARLDPLLAAVAEVAPAPWRVVAEADATLPASWRPAAPRDWHWMSTRTAPGTGTATEPVVVEIDDPAEVDALLDEGNADSYARPGLPGVECWVGVRLEGRLVSTGALVRQAADGTGLLRGITTLPSYGGRGLASAVSAELTRRALARGSGWATLGVWTDDEPALRVYRRLGFVVGHTFSAGVVAKQAAGI